MGGLDGLRGLGDRMSAVRTCSGRVRRLRRPERNGTRKSDGTPRWRSAQGPVLAVFFAMLLASATANAYLFYSVLRIEGSQVVGSEYAVRWSPEVWGPDQTLVWEIEPDSGFETFFNTPQGVMPFVERALAAWSDISTADISWRVSGVRDESDGVDPYANRSRPMDDRSTVFVDSESVTRSYARIWFDLSGGAEKIVECDVPFGAVYFERLNERLNDNPEGLDYFREELLRDWIQTLVHEFGHCLGLRHSASLSPTSRWIVEPRFELVHPGDAAMSYGVAPEKLDGLAADDVVGASLLRSARGWRRTTGSLSGSVGLDGEPVRYAHVWALPLDGDPLRDRVGAFSDGEGAFLIEGLRPGDYALWAQPINSLGAFPDLVASGVPTDLDDTVSARPIRVRAGRTTGDLEIAMRRGRTVRPPPDAIGTTPDAETLLPITRDWGNPCSGIRIRAEERPYPADGPLWFTEYDERFRRERWFATRMTVEWSAEAGNAVFDWAGPYRNWSWNREEEQTQFWKGWEQGADNRGVSSPALDISISDWRMENTGSVVRLVMDIAWPETTEARLRFRSEDDACDGEPMVICSLDGCGITR